MDKERLARFVFGGLLVVCGYMFVYELKFVSFLMGLMMLGFAVDPRGVQDDLTPAKKMDAAAAEDDDRIVSFLYRDVPRLLEAILFHDPAPYAVPLVRRRSLGKKDIPVIDEEEGYE